MQNQSYNHDIQNSEFAAPVATVSNLSESFSISWNKTEPDKWHPDRQHARFWSEAVVFLGKVGLGISAEHLQQSKVNRYDSIFLILDQEDIYTGETITLPKTLCVRLRFRGSHIEAPAHYEKLLDYITKEQIQIVGFSREITLIDYGITNDSEKFVTEICIPVKCR